MPKKMHDSLKREAKKKGLTGERADAYVYGALEKYKKRKDNKNKAKVKAVKRKKR